MASSILSQFCIPRICRPVQVALSWNISYFFPLKGTCPVVVWMKMTPMGSYSCIFGSQIGETVWEGLDCVTLLEMVWHRGWALKFQKPTTFMVSPLWLMVGLKMWAISYTSNLCQKLVAMLPAVIIVSKCLKLQGPSKCFLFLSVFGYCILS